jgi:hypothetical protein
VIEANLEDFHVDPSQGSHFFHNMTSLGLGYFHIQKPTPGEGEFIDWEWIKSQKVYGETKYVKHLRFSKSLQVKINARNSRGVILKPLGEGSLYAAQTGGVGFHSFPGEGAAS